MDNFRKGRGRLHRVHSFRFTVLQMIAMALIVGVIILFTFVLGYLSGIFLSPVDVAVQSDGPPCVEQAATQVSESTSAVDQSVAALTDRSGEQSEEMAVGEDFLVETAGSPDKIDQIDRKSPYTVGSGTAERRSNKNANTQTVEKIEVRQPLTVDIPHSKKVPRRPNVTSQPQTSDLVKPRQPEKTPPTAIDHTVYTIQTGAFRTAKNAGRLVAALREKGFDAFMSSNDPGKKGQWYRVLVGRYENKRDADTTVSELRAMSFTPAFVTVQK